MDIASLNELKKELKTLPKEELLNICLRLARYKKENKELLNYLIFEAQDENAFINKTKETITLELAEMNQNGLYLAKKTIRKALRTASRSIKYSGNKQTEVELLIHFCKELTDTQIRIRDSKVLTNLYQRQLNAIKKALSTLHEDLQSDYEFELKQIERALR